MKLLSSTIAISALVLGAAYLFGHRYTAVMYDKAAILVVDSLTGRVRVCTMHVKQAEWLSQGLRPSIETPCDPLFRLGKGEQRP